jgi:hypothetical protein
MDTKKPQFSFGTPTPPEDRVPTVRELRLLDESQKEPQPADGYNPYDREPEPPPAKTAATTRTDLRKLSEWILLKKGVDERKETRPESEAATPTAAPDPEPVVEEYEPTVRIPRPKL